MAPVEISDAEWRVMNVVWEGSPVTARAVRQALAAETGWAYTTVKTLLDRLEAKGAVTCGKEGAAKTYTPRLGREEARRGAAKDLADKAFSGSLTGLVHFLLEDERLTPKDAATLKKIVEGPRPKGRGRRR
jgi:BlaI family penicillinase repressor